MKDIFSNNLRYLRKKYGKSQTDIGLQLNKAHTSIGNWEKGISEPSLSEIEHIARIFEIGIAELLTLDLSNVEERKKSEVKKREVNVEERVEVRVEENADYTKKKAIEPMVAEQSASYMPKVVTVDSRGEENMVLVPVKARAGYLSGYGDTAFIQSLPAYRLPGYNNGTFRMFEVKGASMHPTLNDGDIVIARSVETLDNIRNDRIHVIICHDGIVVKRVLNRIQTDNKLILKSDNVEHKHDYPNMVIDPSDVIELWYAVAFISHVMKSPSEIYNRMIDLEGRLTILEHNAKK